VSSREKREPRPVTARPRGSHFFVESRGLRHAQHRTPAPGVIEEELEDCSDNRIMGGEGCYRTLPTCRE